MVFFLGAARIEPAFSQKLSAIDPEFTKGVALFKEHKYPEAAHCFETCLHKNPAESAALVQLAACYHHGGDPARARALYLLTISTFPGTPAAARAQELVRSAEAAVSQTRSASLPKVSAIATPQSSSLDGIDANLKAGQSHVQAGHWGEAERSYLLALREAEQKGARNPRLIEIYEKLHSLAKTKGDAARACVFHEKELSTRELIYGKNHPDTVACAFRCAPYCEQANELSRAEELYRRSYENFQRDLEQAESRNKPDLAPERARVTGALSSLAAVLRKQNRVGEAKQLEVQVKMMQEPAN